MPGLSVKLPLSLDFQDGYTLNKTYPELIKQNFKHLILTIPGEKMMDPEFGAGLQKLLFEQNGPALRSEIMAAIHGQIEAYMSFLEINEVKFFGIEESPQADPNSLRLVIDYSIPSLNIVDFLDITL